LKTIIIALLGVGCWLAATQSRANADTNKNWSSLEAPPSLDRDLSPQTDAIAASRAAPATNSAPPDSEDGGDSDVGASFVLIGLGVGVLIGIRWRMSRSSDADTLGDP
jgi:hypothetical protein